MTTGSTGVGGACHLDYIVTIDGKVVDAQCAVGQEHSNYTYGNSSVHHGAQCPAQGPINLCSPEVREALKKHANQILKGTGKENFNIADGTTGGTGNPNDEHNHEEDETKPGTVVNQGTGDVDGTGGVPNPPPVIEEPQPDPEETDDPPPTPSEEYDSKSATPICDNSTCITQDTIDNAKHKRVEYDKADPHWDYLKADGACKPPTKTGLTVFRQVVGAIKDYPDSFCTNQGCTYINSSSSGDGKCQ
ncbi:MAG TPA: hypothetical protein PLF01_05485 [Alphaproteobacteria bacterium]|nr:hypothetical protein [Alphaproteobacteria bacterium]